MPNLNNVISLIICTIVDFKEDFRKPIMYRSDISSGAFPYGMLQLDLSILVYLHVLLAEILQSESSVH